MRRSVTMTSKASSASALTAAWTPSASVTRWPRFFSRSARVVRAEDSSSTTRIAAIVLSSAAQREEDGEGRTAAGRRRDLDPPPVRGHDALGDGEPEAGTPVLPGEEGLEDPPPRLLPHPTAGVGDGDRYLGPPEADRDAEAAAPLDRLDAVQRDIPKHLGHLVGVERERRDRRLHAHIQSYPLGPAGFLPDQGRNMIDDLANVHLEPLGLTGSGKDEEVREDLVETSRLLFHGAQRMGAFVARERLLRSEERRRVDDGRQRVPNLVGNAGRQLAHRRQTFGLGEPRVQPLPLGHVGDELEKDDLAVRLAHGRTAQREAPAIGARDLGPLRVPHPVPGLERAAGASLPVGGEHLVAAAVADRAELPVHPAVGVSDSEIAVDQPETLAEAVHEP